MRRTDGETRCHQIERRGEAFVYTYFVIVCRDYRDVRGSNRVDTERWKLDRRSICLPRCETFGTLYFALCIGDRWNFWETCCEVVNCDFVSPRTHETCV